MSVNEQPANNPSAIIPDAGGFGRLNPVALKELRGRMRGARAFIVLTVYVLFMSLFTALIYAIYSASNDITLSTSGGVVGKLIFASVVAVELFLVCFIAPAFTSSAISGERERQTLNLLRTTLLPARRLVLGKLASAMAYVLLLLTAAVPLQSLAFLMGGVIIEEVLLSFWLLIVTALSFSAMGIFFSAMTKRTLSATVLTYAAALFITVALPIASLALAAVSSSFSFSRQSLAELIATYALYLVSSLNPIATAILTETALQQSGNIFVNTGTISSGLGYSILMPWIIYSVVYLLLTLVLVMLSVRYVNRYEAS